MDRSLPGHQRPASCHTVKNLRNHLTETVHESLEVKPTRSSSDRTKTTSNVTLLVAVKSKEIIRDKQADRRAGKQAGWRAVVSANHLISQFPISYLLQNEGNIHYYRFISSLSYLASVRDDAKTTDALKHVFSCLSNPNAALFLHIYMSMYIRRKKNDEKKCAEDVSGGCNGYGLSGFLLCFSFFFRFVKALISLSRVVRRNISLERNGKHLPAAFRLFVRTRISDNKKKKKNNRFSIYEQQFAFG